MRLAAYQLPAFLLRPLQFIIKVKVSLFGSHFS
jgi:hypothetical protein